MTDNIIHIDGADLIARLDEHGWAQGAWEDAEGAICAHQAIRLCSPQPGDAHLIEQVANRQGWGTGWNDDDATTETMVRDRLAVGVDVTDDDLADTFGPQWRAVVAVVRRAAKLTAKEARLVAATRAATRVAARDATWVATRDATWGAAGGAAGVAAWDAALDATWGAAGGAAGVAAWDATRDAAWDAARTVVAWDLATADGPFTVEHRDLLIGPWLTVQPDLLDHIVEVQR